MGDTGSGGYVPLSPVNVVQVSQKTELDEQPNPEEKVLSDFISTYVEKKDVLRVQQACHSEAIHTLHELQTWHRMWCRKENTKDDSFGFGARHRLYLALKRKREDELKAEEKTGGERPDEVMCPRFITYKTDCCCCRKFSPCACFLGTFVTLLSVFGFLAVYVLASK